MEQNNLIVAHMNSGKTWISGMIVSTGTPVKWSQQGISHKQEGRIPFDKWKEYYDKYPNRLQNTNLVFLHRDPKDVMVSHYLDMKIGGVTGKGATNPGLGRGGYHGDLSDCIRDPVVGLYMIINFNLYWKENVSAKSVKFITYENFRCDTENQLQQVCEFFGNNVTTEKIQEVVHNHSFNIQQAQELEILKRKFSSNEVNTDMLKVRRGVVGGYVDYMTEQDIEYCDNMLKQYNYYERMK